MARPFWKDRTGSVALEFVLTVPLMIFTMLGLYQVWFLATANRQIETVADSIAQMLTQNTTGSVSDVDLGFVASSAMVLFPTVLTDASKQNVAWSSIIKITISSVVFVAQSNGSYLAQVAWSRGPNKRPCGSNLSAQSDADPPSPTALPQDLFGSGSLIVVDVSYDYKPQFLSDWFASSYGFSKSAYLQPRYITSPDYIQHSNSNADGAATVCTGYL
jgi:hypothetical protein